MKHKFPLCYSVAYYNARYFRYHAFKVKEDKEMILSLIKAGDEVTLQFYELFYKEMMKTDRACEKDISSRNEKTMLSLNDLVESPSKRKKSKISE